MQQKWANVLWFILAVFVALMFLPRESVMWFLVVVLAGMLITNVSLITSSANA